ncbi:bifunctional DNA primase/polymerase [Bacillus luteolus]|uniref:Bifunctional DNA primase/polymerase n=1 Tax=Litchfieldia luteola TaxID=682179 RepID=A0ABR9QHA2_9BACI|nr:phage/plasmid primase, P4 family [Cytobacillus luteolus]MBE4907869.1 bifunctional DNA primase/polymerase [Cytobacillus luteolus]MBP1943973.1 putative DNA primase/helicase [Cytobacillus luteolus]
MNETTYRKLLTEGLKKYQELGLPIFPCKGKKPLIKNWKYRGAPTDVEINEWLEKYPGMNIGMVLGTSSNQVGIDVEGEGGYKILKDLCLGDLPETLQFSTPSGGMRYLYRIPANETHLKKFTKTDKTEKHSECALLGEGQMTIMPPSVGENGIGYEWINGPSDVEISNAPGWMISLMKTAKKQIGYSHSDIEVLATLRSKCPAFDEDTNIQRENGLDNDTWFKWISLLTNAGYHESAKIFSKASFKHNSDSDKRLELLRNNRINGMVRCSTLQCSEDQIRRCFQNDIRLNKSGEISNSPGFFLSQEKQSISNWTQAKLENIGFQFTKSGEFKGINGNIYARHLLQELDIVYVSAGDRYCTYDNGIWVYLDRNNLSRKLRNILHQYKPDIWTSSLEDVYLEALKVEATRVEKLDSNKGFINLNNGMFNLSNFQLEPHDKKYYSSVRVPITYNPEADCLQFMQFLDDVFEGDQERINLIGEVLGYCLTAETKAQKAILLYGRGSNGKSVLAEIITYLCGRENVSSVPIQDLEKPFARFELVDKLINLATENEVDKNGLNTTHFKSIVTGDPIRVERKYEPGFTYQPICKLVFALNNLPYSRDKSNGFLRRLLIVPFNRSFSKNEKDPDLIGKLKTEMSGILNFALEGLKRLRNNKYDFSESKVVNEAVAEYTENLNPIKSFVDERIIVTGNPLDRVSHASLKRAYELWCSESGFSGNQTTNSRSFIKNVKDTLKDNSMQFDTSKSGNHRYITEVKLKNNQTITLEDDMSIFDM